MKKAILLIGLVVILGAGCASVQPPPVTQKPAEPPAPAAVIPEPPTQKASPAKSIADLKEALPVVHTDQPLEDDSGWTMVTRNGVTVTYPAKGPNAMKLTVILLASDDSHLQSGCYVTSATVSKRTDFPSYDPGGCQTVTLFGAGAGTRTDYFVFQNHLITMTKTYPSGFDMDGYDRIVEKVINIID